MTFSPRAATAPASATVAELVAAARHRDRAAFAELHRRFARMVHGVILARAPRAVADDLVQDVFVSAIEHLGNLRDDAAFGGWLATMARHRAASWARARKDETPFDDRVAGAAPGGGAGVGAECAQALAALRGLPEAYREPLILRLVEGMSGPEIAEQTGLTPASVRVNLHRGMKLLRQRLGLAPAAGPAADEDPAEHLEHDHE